MSVAEADEPLNTDLSAVFKKIESNLATAQNIHVETVQKLKRCEEGAEATSLSLDDFDFDAFDLNDNMPSQSSQHRLMPQLFPIDDSTRAALVAGGFKPHLELTFRAKKPLTGLMRHLAAKWAAALPHLHSSLDPKTSVLQLYPFEASSAADATGVWNGRHDGVTATDICDALGKPAAFMVRYGWVPAAQAALPMEKVKKRRMRDQKV